MKHSEPAAIRSIKPNENDSVQAFGKQEGPDMPAAGKPVSALPETTGFLRLYAEQVLEPLTAKHASFSIPFRTPVVWALRIR